MTGGFGPWATTIDPAERRARVRELRAIAAILAGPSAPITRALAAAVYGDIDALDRALAELDRAPPLLRRKVLATFASLSRAA